MFAGGRCTRQSRQFFVFLVGIGHDIGLEPDAVDKAIAFLGEDCWGCLLVIGRMCIGGVVVERVFLEPRLLLCLWVGVRHGCTFDIFWRFCTITFLSLVQLLLLFLLLKGLVLLRFFLAPCVLMGLATHELLLLTRRETSILLGHLYCV